MKIRKSKQMNLHQLIEYITDNELKTVSGNLLEYSSDYENKVFVDYSGQISTYGKFFNDTFTVSTEEELTEETVFSKLFEVHFDLKNTDIFSYKNRNVSITDIKEEDAYEVDSNVLAIYYKDTLIWSKDTGIPTEGVIEV